VDGLQAEAVEEDLIPSAEQITYFDPCDGGEAAM
jgi:hypothetical protein